jgi:hypothetical protein
LLINRKEMRPINPSMGSGEPLRRVRETPAERDVHDRDGDCSKEGGDRNPIEDHHGRHREDHGEAEVLRRAVIANPPLRGMPVPPGMVVHGPV